MTSSSVVLFAAVVASGWLPRAGDRDLGQPPGSVTSPGVCESFPDTFPAASASSERHDAASIPVRHLRRIRPDAPPRKAGGVFRRYLDVHAPAISEWLFDSPAPPSAYRGEPFRNHGMRYLPPPPGDRPGQTCRVETPQGRAARPTRPLASM